MVLCEHISPPPIWASKDGLPTLAATRFLMPHEVPHLVVARGEHALVVEWATYRSMLRGETPFLGQLSSVPCKCRSKTKILTNAFLTPAHLHELDIAGLGAQCISEDTVNLGLMVYGGITLHQEGHTVEVPRQTGIDYFASKALKKLDKRKGRILQTPHSIKDKISYCNAYCISGFAYVESCSAILPVDLNKIYKVYTCPSCEICIVLSTVGFRSGYCSFSANLRIFLFLSFLIRTYSEIIG